MFPQISPVTNVNVTLSSLVRSVLHTAGINPHPFNIELSIRDFSRGCSDIRKFRLIFYEIAKTDHFLITKLILVHLLAELFVRGLFFAPSVGKNIVVGYISFEELLELERVYVE